VQITVDLERCWSRHAVDPGQSRLHHFLSASMGRRAKIEFAAVKSSLVNLPLSLYGPLVERQVVCVQLLNLLLDTNVLDSVRNS
jgi:DNA mismatch repair protein MutH